MICKTEVENIYLYLLQIKTKTELCIVVYACNPSTEEAEAGGSYISSQELIAEAMSWRWHWLPILYKVSSGG